MDDMILVHSDDIYHWGIKGQKWGVRRFQNEDGTLTEAGKKRYYKGTEINGILGQMSELTKAGKKLNQKNEKIAYKYAKRVAKNLRNNAQLKKYTEEYEKLRKKNNKNYLEERDKWLSQTDYKRKDYYKFKDEARDRWYDSEDGKKELEMHKRIRDIYDQEAKKDPMYNKTLVLLSQQIYSGLADDVNFGRQRKYGEYIVKRLTSGDDMALRIKVNK